MKRESSWGLGGILAIAAAVGIAVQPWNQGAVSPRETTSNTPVSTTVQSEKPAEFSSACSGLAGVFANFLDIEKSKVGGPAFCYQTKPPARTNSHISDSDAMKRSDMKFVVATVPDPVHTHLALTFDRFAESIQQAAQDEEYLFESSWLPWEEDKSSYALLADQDVADRRKSERENQPGIILFRKNVPDTKDESKVQRKALAVFVVGEEATAGIHRGQFRNASAWIEHLSGTDTSRTLPVAILGPSFSGSFSSLDQLLSDPVIWNRLQPPFNSKESELAVYSGSANAGARIREFKRSHPDLLDFHTFLEDDDVLLLRFIGYIDNNSSGDEASHIAILSEEDTAFGNVESTNETLNKRQLRLSYSRDISSLRSAYQSKSIFGIASTPSQSEARGRSLPTDLADSAGKTHDNVHSYGGNQSPLSQEAYLNSIVNSLHEARIRYLILRGTNSLDILFLANFFRRALPDARIVVDSPDTLFQRERGATSLSGTMTLATYPLFVQEQNWTGAPWSHERRQFKSEVSEGVYIALRLLLNSRSLHPDVESLPGCHVTDESRVILPAVECKRFATLPNYTPPLWLGSQCNISDKEPCIHPGPVGWLSVIGHNTFWPLATLSSVTDPNVSIPPALGWTRPEVPVSIKLVLIFVFLLSLFQCWCCFSASFTAKPAFLAHFATIEKSKHELLIAIGCFSIAAMSLWIGWGSGFFLNSSRPFEARWPIAVIVVGIWMSCACAYMGSYARNWQLSYVPTKPEPTANPRKRSLLSSLVILVKRSFPDSWLVRVKRTFLFSWLMMLKRSFLYPWAMMVKGSFLASPKAWVKRFSLFVSVTFVFLLIFAGVLEMQLPEEDRFLTHWRAVHLGSGVSPLVPALLIVAGVYVWFWFSLHGLALFGKERCVLPGCSDLIFKGPNGANVDVLRVFSKEDISDIIDPLAKPLSRDVWNLALFLAVLFFGASYLMEEAFPLRSLGVTGYSILIDILFCACLGLMFAETWQLYRIWGQLHRLLAFLDYIPLRRTLAAFHGFSWGNLWKMSGNVLDVRYKLLSRQLESRNHLATSLQEKITSSEKELPEKWSRCEDDLKRCPDVFRSAAPSPAPLLLEQWKRIISSNDLELKASAISEVIQAAEHYCASPVGKGKDDDARKLRSSLMVSMDPLREFLGLTEAMNAIKGLQSDSMKLADWYAKNYQKSDAGNLDDFATFQKHAAKAAGLILSSVLAPQWRKEGNSLVIASPDQEKKAEEGNPASSALAKDLHIRNAEEFVSFPFLGFAQNILGRMRTIVMGILAMFLTVTLAVSSYPFDPRHAISIALVGVFVILGGVITYVYADMHRDSTLSHLTNTRPGELGTEFWFKIIGFGIGPLLGLVATIFPEIGDFVISWLQPGINSVR